MRRRTTLPAASPASYLTVHWKAPVEGVTRRLENYLAAAVEGAAGHWPGWRGEAEN
jgi:hypothetical protein